MAKRIFSATVKERAIVVSDFTELDGNGVNIRVKKDGLFPALKKGTKTADFFITQTPISVYAVGSTYYAYCADKYIRRANLGTKLVDAKFNSRPDFITVSFGGTDYSFFVAANQSYSFSGSAVISFKGTSATLFRNSLFVIDGGEVKFSAPFDFLDDYNSLKADESFKPEENIGSALKIAHGFDKLYVLCEKGIVIGELKGKETDYAFKGVYRAEQSVDNNSALAFGDKLCFIENGKLAVYDGGKLKTFDTVLSGHEYEVLKEPFAFNGYYLADVKLDGDNSNKKTLAVNIYTGESFFIKFASAVLCGDGFICDGTAHAIYPLTEDGGSAVGDSTFSFSHELGLFGQKTITSISAYAEGSPAVSLSCLGGNFTFTLGNGYSEVKLGALSQKFDFFVQSSGSFTLKDLKIKYLTGE